MFTGIVQGVAQVCAIADRPGLRSLSLRTQVNTGMGLLSASLSVLTLSMSAPGEQGANSSALQLCEAIAVAATLAIGGSLFAALLETSAQAAYLANFGVAAGAAVLAAVIVGRTDTRQVFVG